MTEKPEPELYKYLGDGYCNVKKFVPARDYYDKLIDAGVKDKDVFYKRGLMQLEANEYAAALSDFDNAQKAGENTVLLFLNKGRAHLGVEDTKSAVLELNKAVDLDPKNVDAHFNRALVKEAIEDWRALFLTTTK